jgi:hypothetical protein
MASIFPFSELFETAGAGIYTRRFTCKPTTFSGRELKFVQIPAMMLPEPINAYIPPMALGLSRKDVKVEDFITGDPIFEVNPAQMFGSGVIGSILQPYLAAAASYVMTPYCASTDLSAGYLNYWRLETKAQLLPNEPFCVVLVLQSLIPKEFLQRPWAAICWGKRPPDPPRMGRTLSDTIWDNSWRHLDCYEWSVRFSPDIPPMLYYYDKLVATVDTLGSMWMSQPLMELEGQVRAPLIMTARGHLLILDAGQGQVLWSSQSKNALPRITAINPYIGFPPSAQKSPPWSPTLVAKPPTEPIYHGGSIVIEGFNCVALIAIPSVDFATEGEIPIMTVSLPKPSEAEGDVTSKWFVLDCESYYHRKKVGEFRPRALGQTFKLPCYTEGGFKLKPVYPVPAHKMERLPGIPIYLGVFGAERPQPTGRLSFRFHLKFMQELPPSKSETGTAQYFMTLEYQAQPYRTWFSTLPYFELVAAAVEIPPAIVTRKILSSELSLATAVTDCQIVESERETKATFTYHPLRPTDTVVIGDTPTYAEIEISWESLSGGASTMSFRGFVTSVEVAEEGGYYGLRRFRATVESVAKRLKDTVGDYTFPHFDGWSVKEIFQYCFIKAGLDPDEFLLFCGNDVRLTPQLLWWQPTPDELPPWLLPEIPQAGFPYWYTPEKARFQIRAGQSVWAFLEELCAMTGNEVLDLGFGTVVVPSAYEMPQPVIVLSDAAHAPSSSYYPDCILTDLSVSGKTGWQPNVFIAMGKTRLGAPCIAYYELPQTFWDVTSPAFKGFRQAHVEVDEKIATPELAARRAYLDYLSSFREIPVELSVALASIPPLIIIPRDKVEVNAIALQAMIAAQGVRPTRVAPNQWTVREVTYVFDAKLERSQLKLRCTPPIGIPQGLILPRR